MHACKKFKIRFTVLVLLLSLWPSLASSRGFKIDHIEARHVGESIKVDGKLTLNLTDDVRKALSKSIPLQLEMEFVLNRVRNYVWDKEVAIWIVPIAIHYKPISDEYVVSRPDLINQQESFGSQHAALERIGAFNDLNLPLEHPILHNKEYILEARIKLDLSQLPAMMRPMAYFSSSWHLNSKWTEWLLKH